MEIRTPDGTKNKLEEIEKITIVKVFIKEIMDLLLNFYKTEGKKTVKFDQSSGKPLEFDWFPEQKFDGKFYTHSGFIKNIEVSKEISKFFDSIIKNGPQYFEYNGKNYIIQGFLTSYYGSVITGGVEILPIKKLLV